MAEEPTRRALVIGTGLIGGSIGLGLRRRGWRVTGRDADPGRAEEALTAGVLDEIGDDLDAEVIFIAVPAAQVPTVASGVLGAPGRRADAVVSDVSGVKGAIVESLTSARFIGGHPMAGSEQIGLSGADSDLFVGATWVLTPTTETDLDAFALLQGVISSLGADVIALSAKDHDRLVAVVSHVPHLVAATLMNAAAQDAKEDAALLRLAAGGFRDMTRVAAGQPTIWPDICAENKDAIVAALDRLLADLAATRARVATDDRSGLLESLEQASVARRALPAKATRPDNLAEVRVPVPDREGVLAELTALASDRSINIYDIEIAHSSEGPRGVLILLVDLTEAARLKEAITGRGYRCTVQDLA